MIVPGYKVFFVVFGIIFALIFFNYQNYLYIDVDMDILRFSLAKVEVDNQPKKRFIGFYQNEYYVGKGFDLELDRYLDQLDLLHVKPVDSKIVLNSEPVIVTAFSSNHFGEAQTLLKSVKKIYKGRKILFIYDLGLKDHQIEEILMNYNSSVLEIMKFPFHLYPGYVSKLYQYRWKPLVIALALKKFPVIWYMDASVEIKQSLSRIYQDFYMSNNESRNSSIYPWQLGINTEHSIYAATNPKIYKYFPMPDGLAKNISMYEAGYQLIYNLKTVKENILQYLVLCALQKDCMSPTGSHLSCKFKKERYNRYMKCHRFDQSVINILLSWANEFREEKYNHPIANSAILKGK